MEQLRNRFPEIAARETRSLSVLTRGALGSLPRGEYGFTDMYCNEKGCDCRRVMVVVFESDLGEEMATINMGFDSRGEAPGPFLDPLGKQSEHAETLMQLFVQEINRDPEYLARLHRHYVMFKEAVNGHPYRGRPFEPPGSVERQPQSPSTLAALLGPELPARRGPKVGRNGPCPCGSGKKHKKCCLFPGGRPPS